jgi:hypothetical protein
MKHASLVAVGIVCCAAACECRGKENAVVPETAGSLYSGSSIDEAIAFTTAPDEKRDQFKNVVKGTLADPTHLAVARSLLEARDPVR